MLSDAVNPGGRLLVVGGGYTGQRFARAASARGLAVTLTHRPQPQGEQLAGSWLGFDSRQGLVPSAEELAGTTHLLVTVPPDGGEGDPTLRLLGSQLQQLPIRWVGYLSTTGVYGDTGGAWADETSPTAARAGRSQARLQAEQHWLASELPVQIFRLPAIYGPGRSPFAALRQGQSRLIYKPGQMFCRIHVDDIVGAMLHCLALPPERRLPLLNLVDDRPCPSSETLGYAAHLLGLKLPAAERFSDIAAELSPMARSFWAENRRVGNHRLCRQLGYELLYPSYRQGYRACLREEGEAPAAAPLGGGQSPPARPSSAGNSSSAGPMPRSRSITPQCS
jgi:nucleoside-diphosphate-sugar epimerase